MNLIVKKILVLLVSWFAINGVVAAGHDKAIQTRQLPIRAQEFIKQHFPSNDIALVKMEYEFLDRSYEVFFVSGDKLDFRCNGKWKMIDCKFSDLTTIVAVVPQQITDYVAKFYSEFSICQIERDRKGYEIQLSNGIELNFDRKYRIINIDNTNR